MDDEREAVNKSPSVERSSGSVSEEKGDRRRLGRYCHLGHRYIHPYHHLGDDREIDSNQMQV